MSQNLNDLIEAGKKVLKQQEKAEKLTGDDPYSFLMEEEANPVTPLVPPVPSEIPGIKNVPTEEELKQMEEAYQPTEERIFENGPYASEAKLWKKQYGGRKCIPCRNWWPCLCISNLKPIRI